MLFSLSEYLTQFYSGFNVFQYLTMRTILGVLTALIISLIVGPVMISYLSSYKIEQSVRDDGPESHHSKAGTPTMGGALILVSVIAALVDKKSGVISQGVTDRAGVFACDQLQEAMAKATDEMNKKKKLTCYEAIQKDDGMR